jgi:D-alanyl-D-alanine carboxypeptidase/D-alanyl-D-alanine-endopeptidase (penicillin-binding protein 4)
MIASFNRKLALGALLFAMSLAIYTPAQADGTELARATRDGIAAQLQKASGKRGVAAMTVLDLETGQVLYQHNHDKTLAPASNMKLLTSLAALELLGDEFEFITRVYADGRVSDGVLHGDLCIIGGGDPNLSGRFYDDDPVALFKQWAAKLKQAGVTRVTGALRYDSTLFGQDSYSDSWPKDDQYIKWYCAEVSALAFNDNCVGVRVLPGKAGQKATIELVPPTATIKIINETTTAPGRKGAEIGIVRPRDQNTITVKGKVYEQASWGYYIDVAVHDPARYAAEVLKETLVAQGIAVGGETAPVTMDAAMLARCTVLHEHRSSLLEALGPINTNSQNLHAEMLFRQLGLRYAGKGTFKTSQAAMQDYLHERGMWQDGLVISDGSGLARDNRVTTQLLASLLRRAHGKAWFGAFRDSLARAGETGTLEKRLTDKALEGVVYAKTGYISNVRALSGYILKDDRKLVFSILMNDCAYSRETQDEIVKLLAKG